MKKRKILILAVSLTLLSINFALAHPGRTDSSGCHTCKTNCEEWGLSYGEYHCHNTPKLTPTPALTPEPTPAPKSTPTTIPEPTLTSTPAPALTSTPEPTPAPISTLNTESTKSNTEAKRGFFYRVNDSIKKFFLKFFNRNLPNPKN